MADYDDDPAHPDRAPMSSDPETLGRRVKELEAELATAREESRQNHDRWLRERADLENVRKRAIRERQDVARYGCEQLLRDLLPVLDDLDRAVAAAQGGGNGQPLVEGVELVRKAFMDALQRHGVERVASDGERFDPARHEAVGFVESDTHDAQQVVEEHRAGYRLHDRLLRPAMVTVSKGKRGRSNLANEEGGD
jgi:molecular chaperone GrpE